MKNEIKNIGFVQRSPPRVRLGSLILRSNSLSRYVAYTLKKFGISFFFFLLNTNELTRRKEERVFFKFFSSAPDVTLYIAYCCLPIGHGHGAYPAAVRLRSNNIYKSYAQYVWVNVFDGWLLCGVNTIIRRGVVGGNSVRKY